MFVILIDEYDVPLDKAYQSGYYDAMVELIRVLFGNAFKTNGSLYFAVLTGCLRISKESIFTGLNNFNVYTVNDVQYKEYFGFTDNEVQELLQYYGFKEKYNVIKEWYNGYNLNGIAMHNPLSVVRVLLAKRFQQYWTTTGTYGDIDDLINMNFDGLREDIIKCFPVTEYWWRWITASMTCRLLRTRGR